MRGQLLRRHQRHHGERDGYDFEVAIVDDDWVFRFPRRAGVEEALGLEIVLLPLLAPALSVNVPSFEHISRDPLFVDKPDPHINALGCRGVGEIGITGVAAAVANASRRLRPLSVILAGG